MGMTSMKEYHNIYLKQDFCLKNYQLNPAKYYTPPDIAYDTPLKINGVKPDLITDQDMLLMFEKGNRVGITLVTPI